MWCCQQLFILFTTTIPALPRSLHLGHADEVVRPPPSISTKALQLPTTLARLRPSYGRSRPSYARSCPMYAPRRGPHRSVIFQQIRPIRAEGDCASVALEHL